MTEKKFRKNKEKGEQCPLCGKILWGEYRYLKSFDGEVVLVMVAEVCKNCKAYRKRLIE